MENVGAIILAAGKGKRMKSKKINKVVIPLGNKPMILHTISLVKSLQIKTIIAVVGFAKESVMKILDHSVIFAEQKNRLGTAHAVLCALEKLPKNIKVVLVLNGDDSAFYKRDVIAKLINVHIKNRSSLSFLTINVNNPSGLGRVVRSETGEVLGIVEDKDASENQRKIKEINSCYVFDISFLKRYLKKVKKSPVTGEYYLTKLIDLAIANGERVETVKSGKIPWRGINTIEELRQAEEMFLQAR